MIHYNKLTRSFSGLYPDFHPIEMANINSVLDNSINDCKKLLDGLNKAKVLLHTIKIGNYEDVTDQYTISKEGYHGEPRYELSKEFHNITEKYRKSVFPIKLGAPHEVTITQYLYDFNEYLVISSIYKDSNSYSVLLKVLKNK